MGWTPDFFQRAQKGDLTVGIIGLGYVGLPTAIGFHDAGFNVWGVDISERTVEMVKRGENPTGDPDVDDIVPKPGSKRWISPLKFSKQYFKLILFYLDMIFE